MLLMLLLSTVICSYYILSISFRLCVLFEVFLQVPVVPLEMALRPLGL